MSDAYADAYAKFCKLWGDTGIRPDEYSFALHIISDSGVRTVSKEDLYEKTLSLMYRLNDYMDGEIFNHLLEKHRNTFIQMKNEQRQSAEIDKFLEENMPNARQVFADGYAKFREFWLRKLSG